MYSKTPKRPLPELESPQDSSDQDYAASHHPSTEGVVSTTAELTSAHPASKPNKYKLSRQRRRQREAHTNSRIEHLEKQIANLNKSRGLCHRCSKLLSAPHCLDLTGSPLQLELEEFEGGARRSLSELRGQIWMVVGLIMLIVGMHIHGLQGSSEVYKFTDEQLNEFRHQLIDGSEELSLTLYYESLLAQQEGSLRVQTIPSDELVLEQRFDVSFRYDNLLRIMDSAKELLCFSTWVSSV